jgi:hypothetical protein
LCSEKALGERGPPLEPHQLLFAHPPRKFPGVGGVDVADAPFELECVVELVLSLQPLGQAAMAWRRLHSPRSDANSSRGGITSWKSSIAMDAPWPKHTDALGAGKTQTPRPD